MFVILGFIGFLYFQFQKELMLQNKRVMMQEYSSELIARLKDLHINFDKYKFYPRDERFNSAIYDSDGQLIFSTLNSSEVNLNKVVYTTSKHVHFIEEPDVFYLGAKYVVLEVKDSQIWLQNVQKTIFLYSVLGFSVLLFIGFFLLRLFLKPMKDSYTLLDRFIKDTTHELNTPISAIVANIELIDIGSLKDERLKKRIHRIDIGAKTVSNIYEDMTYLTLNNKIISQNEPLDMQKLLQQRVEYFNALAEVKKIKMHVHLYSDETLLADYKKISKLIDNLLSNAIKYNRVNGSIIVTFKDKTVTIEDTGVGISEEKLTHIFDRYSRFEKSVGGFGIGLSIVSLIAQEYAIKIDFQSKQKEGTKVSLSW
jgi:two-component system OmpR family sensor kinase